MTMLKLLASRWLVCPCWAAVSSWVSSSKKPEPNKGRLWVVARMQRQTQTVSSSIEIARLLCAALTSRRPLRAACCCTPWTPPLGSAHRAVWCTGWALPMHPPGPADRQGPCGVSRPQEQWALAVVCHHQSAVPRLQTGMDAGRLPRYNVRSRPCIASPTKHKSTPDFCGRAAPP